MIRKWSLNCQTDPIVGESIKVEMYKHKSDKNIRFTCDPKTKQLVSKPSKQFVDFWKTTKAKYFEYLIWIGMKSKCWVTVMAK